MQLNLVAIEIQSLHFLSTYRTRTIIIRGWYTFYPLFEVQKRFFKGFFLKILALCMVSIQEWFLIKRHVSSRTTSWLTLLRSGSEWPFDQA